MDTFFELLDLGSGNVLADFADIDEVLAALRRTAERHGQPAIRNLSLMRIEGDDQFLVAMQDQLADFVEDFTRSTTSSSSVTIGD